MKNTKRMFTMACVAVLSLSLMGMDCTGVIDTGTGPGVPSPLPIGSIESAVGPYSFGNGTNATLNVLGAEVFSCAEGMKTCLSMTFVPSGQAADGKDYFGSAALSGDGSTPGGLFWTGRADGGAVTKTVYLDGMTKAAIFWLHPMSDRTNSSYSQSIAHVVIPLQ